MKKLIVALLVAAVSVAGCSAPAPEPTPMPTLEPPDEAAPLPTEVSEPTLVPEPSPSPVPPTATPILELSDQLEALGWEPATTPGSYSQSFYSLLLEDGTITFTICATGPTSVSDIFAMIAPALKEWGMAEDALQEFEDGMQQRAQTGEGGLGQMGDYLVIAGTSNEDCLLVSVFRAT